MNNYLICIPSRERSDKIIPGKFYPLFKNTGKLRYFVRGEECTKYEHEGLCVCRVPNHYNISNKRNLMLQLAIAQNSEYLFIADDDIKIDIRREDDFKKFRPLENYEEAYEFLKLHMSICGKDYPIVHPILRMHGDKKKYLYEKNCPAIRFVCYHVPTFQKEGVVIDAMETPFMSDRYTQLTMLNLGYPSIALAKYTVDDNGTNTKGGCSITRTPELQSVAAEKLYRLFKPRVALRKKNNGQWSEERLDCTIQWKKFLPKDSLNYIPKEEMEKYISERKNS